MSSRLGLLVLSFLCVALPAWAEKKASVPGVLTVKLASGSYEYRAGALSIPADWNSPVSLRFPEVLLKSARFSNWKADVDNLAVEFTNLPGDDRGQVLMLRGAYLPNDSYSGEVFVRFAKGAPEVSESLQVIAQSPEKYGYEMKGTFYFGAKAAPKQVAATGPRVGVGGVVRVNPDGSYWSTGGVGRHAQYYTGRAIQNPGRPSVAAGFERGLPYGLTRQGQLDALRVGNERYQTLQQHIDNYAMPRFGFFWGMW